MKEEITHVGEEPNPLQPLSMNTQSLFLLATILGLTACGQQAIPRRNATEWQTKARQDLDAAHAIIKSAHPGVIDTENPGFNDWVESGYQQAQSLVANVVDYDAMLSAVRFYTTGFRDGHLTYSDDIRRDEYSITVDGWRVEEVDGKLEVVQTLDGWPASLPPLGAQLLECDGRSPNTIIQNDIAPFVNRRTDAPAREAQIDAFWVLHLPGHELRSCKFKEKDGSELKLLVVYRPLTTRQFFSAIASHVRRGDNKHNEYSRLGDVLWVRAQNFNLQPGTEQAAELDKMLDGLRTETRIKTIVFDVRGNAGGSSLVGDRIFEAATGGLEYDRTHLEDLPRTYAQWRVSELSLASVQRAAERDAELYGADDARTQEAHQFLASLKIAKAEGRQWFEQPGGYKLTRADVIERHGKLRRFAGTVAIVTDGNCVSACLDFADLIKRVPGSVHLGKTTGSDTLYIDMGLAALPSGNHLSVPLKVWRNRLRANNEAYSPDVPLDVNMSDDNAVQPAVLNVLADRRNNAASDQQSIAEAVQLVRKEAANHRLILIGELHGTKQIPILLEQLIAAYSTEGPVLLGLEVPQSERVAFSRFLAPDGNASARSDLLSGSFWQVKNTQHDGRRSYDMIDLIEQVRRLRAEGKSIDVVPYDSEPTAIANSEQRDKAMADRIRNAFDALPRGRFLVLSGNVHAMLERPSDAPVEMQTPMGSYLRDLDPYAIDVSALGGEFWACTKQCGAVPVHPPSETSRRVDGGPYNLLVVLPRLSVAHLIGSVDAASSNSCAADRTCRIEGQLKVMPGGFGAGSIETGQSCYDLALPREILRKAEKWNGKSVSLSGQAFARPEIEGLAWYDVKGRKVESGGCSAIVIYVEKIDTTRHLTGN